MSISRILMTGPRRPFFVHFSFSPKLRALLLVSTVLYTPVPGKLIIPRNASKPVGCNDPGRFRTHVHTKPEPATPASFLARQALEFVANGEGDNHIVGQERHGHMLR